MVGGFNVFVIMIVSAMVHSSSAQTTHIVGGILSWVVPPDGNVTYPNWATRTTFIVGDVLEFNFSTGRHDVAEVTRAAYDSCNSISISPITISSNSPTRINLTSAGEHHFICTFRRHCGLGQRLAINVSSAAPAPQPTTPPPAAAVPATSPPAATPETAPSPAMPAIPPPEATPAPSPSRIGVIYTVGDSLGWVVPPGGPIAYSTWARTRNFIMVGDILEFNFTTGQHDVIEVTKEEFDSCNISTTTTTPITTGPAKINLPSAGEHHYICTFGQHCSFGQKLAINVTAGSGSTVTPPSSSAANPPSTSSTPSPVTAPPQPINSVPSFDVAVLVPFTFLTVALAFLYN